MLAVTLNGRRHDFAEGTTLLGACRQTGIRVPTLCHDDRLKPSGACRLCVVEVEGMRRPAPACSTALADGMVVKTHTPQLESLRRTLLGLLAENYPVDAIERRPDKEFHRLLKEYGLSPKFEVRNPKDVWNPKSRRNAAVDAPVQASAFGSTSDFGSRISDTSHPYLAVDMTKCVTCFRCVRICDEVQGQSIWRAANRGDLTRIVPNGAGTLLATDCVSCGACVDTCPTGALEDQSVLKYGPPTSWTRTTCPYCGVGCEMLVGTRDDCIVQIKPALDASVNKGHLCVKGRYAFDFVRSEERVTSPMIRGSDGDWTKVSWSDAIAFAAQNLERIVNTHGPLAVGVLASARGTNEENYLAQKFARVVLGTNNIDGCARVCHQPTATGMARMLGTGAATNSFADIESAESFLIVGCNPTENHPVVGARIKQAVRRGARLIVIDPRRTELAALADVHLALRPGTNIPLLNALANSILTDHLEDSRWLEQRVDDVGAFRNFIKPWTPERAAGLCGVDAGAIREAARLYATAKPSMCFHGLGVTEHSQGTESVMALVNLALLTGNFGKPGCGINPLRGQNNVQGSAQMGCEPNHLPGYATMNAGREVFERVWKRPLPPLKGLNLPEMMTAAAKGGLKALWAIGYDIAQTNPDAHFTRRALKSIEFVIVQDLFLNETAGECGTLFFPACSSFEKEGTFMNGERRVQRVRRSVPPVGESRPDWKIICDVARAMGHETGFDFPSAESIWNEIRSVWPAGAGMTYHRLERGGLQWPCPDEQHPGTAILHAKEFAESPRARLQCMDYRPTTETTSPEFPYILTTGRVLHQFNAGTMTRRTPEVQFHANDYLEISAADAAALELRNGSRAIIRSRQGAAELPVRISAAMPAGQLFTTFHFPESGVNALTSPVCDQIAATPEYKVTAVRIEKPTPDFHPEKRTASSIGE